MKVKVIKTGYAEGVSRPPKKPLKDYYQKLKEAGYDGPMKIGSMQKWMVKNHPDEVVEFMNQNPPSMNTNKGRNKYKKDWGEYTDAEKIDAFQDNLWDFRDPSPDSEYNTEEEEPDPEFGNIEKDSNVGNFPLPKGSEFKLNDKGTDKEKYDKRNLPFYQAAPDIASFVAAQNTYNYYTPDYTHWEVAPATLNIQPQLDEVDASTKGVYQTTTGNPQIDSIRKQGAFVAGLNAKQQPYANKQNYDANARYAADVANVNARIQEQNFDTAATDTVHNQYRALAKDFATGEKLRAINSLTKKYALNERNENMKKLWLDNFFPNVTSKDGTTDITVGGQSNIETGKLYSTTPEDADKAVITSTETPSPIIKKPLPPSPFYNPWTRPGAIPGDNTNYNEIDNISKKKVYDPRNDEGSYMTTFAYGGYTPIKKKKKSTYY